MLQFPRQISFDGVEPKYVVAGQKRIADYLTTTDIPKLLMTFTPGALVGPKRAQWAKDNLPNIQVTHIGEGVHFVQEDHPEAIGETIQTWMTKHKL
jgi:haloalkane dehalogenase